MCQLDDSHIIIILQMFRDNLGSDDCVLGNKNIIKSLSNLWEHDAAEHLQEQQVDAASLRR